MGWGTVVAVFCHNCGHRNPEGVNFCSSCGHALLADGDDATITLHPTDEAETTEDQPDVTAGRGAARRRRPRGHPGPQHRGALPPGREAWSGRAGIPRATSSWTTSPFPAATSRSRPSDGGAYRRTGRGLVERHVREPGADRRGATFAGRRSPDRQVQARLPGGGERVSSRTYLSIGDVLTLLREEFPDVTISKIRFLETQGLVNPERSPSGYRKFFDHDVERLRWVLRQQREHFLPLKVIRDRLADGELDDDRSGPPERQTGSRTPRRAPGWRRRTAAPVRSGADTRRKADEEAMARILADASRRTARLPEEVQARRGLQVVGDGEQRDAGRHGRRARPPDLVQPAARTSTAGGHRAERGRPPVPGRAGRRATGSLPGSVDGRRRPRRAAARHRAGCAGVTLRGRRRRARKGPATRRARRAGTAGATQTPARSRAQPARRVGVVTGASLTAEELARPAGSRRTRWPASCRSA